MKKTLAPEYNETLKLPVKPTHRRASLKIECFDHDVLSADDSLGACTIDLEPLVLGTEYHTWLKLEGGEDSHGHAIQNNNGEVEFPNVLA
jgi:Ca2+-dependent lipid-binding protein